MVRLERLSERGQALVMVAAVAREHLATARAMYREMDMRFWLGQMEAERD
jgi:hypothetical protein